MLQLIIPAVVGAVTDAIIKESRRPEVPIEPKDASRVAAAVTREVQENPRLLEIEQRLVHQTNNEPWYQSRVTWGAIIAGASPLVASLLGREAFSHEEQMLATAVMASLGSAVGAGIVLYGRWKARKPLGV